VDDLIRVKYSKSETVEDFNEVQHDLARDATPHGGRARSRDRLHGRRAGGTGMGSSRSFVVALLRAFHAFGREYVAPLQLAERPAALRSK